MDLNAGFGIICPNCGQPATFLNHKFKPPGKKDTKAWEVAAYLKNHGFYFQHAYEPMGQGVWLQVPYPRTMEEAREFVLKYKTF